MTDSSIKHLIKWVKGYVKDGQRYYECSCGKTMIAWNMKEAKEKHDE